jgi:hypothetical protein
MSAKRRFSAAASALVELACSDSDNEAEVSKDQKPAIKPESVRRKQRRQKAKMAKMAKLGRFMNAMTNASSQKRCPSMFSEHFQTSFYVDDFYSSKKKAAMKAYTKFSNRLTQHVLIEREYSKTVFYQKRSYSEKELQETAVDKWSIYIMLEAASLGLVKTKWLEVKESQIDGAGLGCFAARDFANGECMGLYIGKILSPTEEPTIYTISSGDADFRVDTMGRGFKDDEAGRAYYGMGFHMANDPCWLPNSDEETVHVIASKSTPPLKHNAYVTMEFLVYATCKISKGKEIFFDYGYDL